MERQRQRLEVLSIIRLAAIHEYDHTLLKGLRLGNESRIDDEEATALAQFL